MRFAVLGLGEAGALFATDLAQSGNPVAAFDPGDVETPAGVVRCADGAGAAEVAEIVLVMTGAAEADAAVASILGAMPPDTLVADLSTSAPADKARRAAQASSSGHLLVDVALMTPVPGRGLRTPSLASGPGADQYATVMRSLGVPVQLVGDHPGDASTRKLLRSVMMKGLAAVVIEAVRAAERAGLAAWLWNDFAAEIEAADVRLLERLLDGTRAHAGRRVHEMEASVALLSSLGVDPVMTRATVESLRHAARDGVPDVPAQAKS